VCDLYPSIVVLHLMRYFWVSASAAFVASFIAKFLADSLLTQRVALIGEFAGLQYSHNPGIAFGLRLPSGVQELFIVIALVFVCVLAWKSAHTRMSQLAYGLVVGGALGNVADRLLDGVVTDFFQVSSFPIFNVADSCITVGVMFLLAESLGLHRRITR